MNKIEVAVIGNYGDPGQMAGFLARLTQRGHKISTISDLQELYNKDASSAFVEALAKLPHGTIKRFTPITVAIVGASRRFLAQARTNQVGFNYVSASLQYSDYSDDAQFVVPYALMEKGPAFVRAYTDSCETAMRNYKVFSQWTDNDTAGYAAPQGLRNILIIQGNYQAWEYFIRLRGCNRNTVETQYVTMLIWDALLHTKNGQEFFGNCGADCMYGHCREGKMCCGMMMRHYVLNAKNQGITVPRAIINDKWPLLAQEVIV